MHVMLRFELEQDIVEGRVELRDLPQRWNEKMWDYLGVEVPDDGHGVLQDVHWSGGSIGYFSTYLIGTVASVQIWEAARRDLPDLEEQVGRGEFTPLREWLGEHVHLLGRKFSPQETLRRATGSTIAAQPYLDYLRRDATPSRARSTEGGGRDSNPRPPGPQPGALPTELPPPSGHSVAGYPLPARPRSSADRAAAFEAACGGSIPPGAMRAPSRASKAKRAADAIEGRLHCDPLRGWASSNRGGRPSGCPS